MKKNIVLRDYQQKAVEKGVWCAEKCENNSLLVLPVGCHSINYPIVMADATIKKVQDIVVGDKVMGNDSTPRTVLRLYKGREKFFKVITKRGESFEVNENHILHLVLSGDNLGKKFDNWQRELNIRVKDYLALPKSRARMYKLKIKGFDLGGDAPIPYLLGLWLGDGTSSGGGFTTADAEVTSYLKEFAEENNLNFNDNSYKYGYSLTNKTEIPRKKKFFNILLDTLKRYNLLKNKHIPEIYFSASREVRLNLLAGLLDTDGSYCPKRNTYEFGLSNERLFNDCVRLCLSLGIPVRKTPRKDCNGKTCWRLWISYRGQEEIPCKISRKKCTARKQKKDSTKKGFVLEEIGEQDFYGFELDGNHLYIDGNGYIQHNSGKSLVVAKIAEELRKDILVLQPSKEILAQNMAKLENYIPKEEIGVYSASFGRKDVRKYNFATIQSIYKKPESFDHIGLVIVDECDLVNPRNSKGMFTSFLKAIGNPVTLGLTATPFRNVTGVTSVNGIVTHGTMLKLINRMNPRMWNRIAFAMNHHELVDKGYLVPLKYISRSNIDHNRIPLNKSRSDFDLEAFERMLEPQEKAIMESINGARKHRNSVLVFCSSVEQAERMAQVIVGGECVSGSTPLKERDRIIEGFKNGDIDVVFNVGVLTVGFDHPKLDCIYMLRPTRSLRLYIQMLGRGTRLAEGKEDCLVIDYSGNFESLGRLENVRLVKEKLWELYANGIPMHNRELFSWSK